jgi:hypothetical protein
VPTGALGLVSNAPACKRDGKKPIDQEYCVNEALKTFGRLFGGTTAFPRAEGVWRDHARGGVLIRDQPVIILCYAAETDLVRQDDKPDPMEELGRFCRRKGRETNQGEIGMVVDNNYIAFTDFSEEE